MRIVQKFGGSSLANRERIENAARRIAHSAREGNQMIAVVSAPGDTTDRLAKLGQEFPCAASAREQDALLGAGEQISAALLALALQSLGQRAVSLNAWQMALRTDGHYADAVPLRLESTRIEQELAAGKIVVATGFQGLDGEGNLTTLGRGGSDTTAVALTALLHADRCEIYTDVDGVYDRDPRLFPEAKRFERIGYEEMIDLARAGAQVLHLRSVEMAKAYRIPIYVRSSFRPGAGTVVE